MSADSGADKGMIRVMAMVGAALVFFTLFCVTVARLLGIGNYDEDDALMTRALIQRIEPVGQVRTDPLPEQEAGGDGEQIASAKSPEELVQGACASCHMAGVAGAPALDDEAAWAERREAGLDNLVASVINGKGNMPARGGSSYSDEEIRLAVQQIAGFEIEEPAAGDEGAAAEGEAAASEASMEGDEGDAAPAEGEAAAEGESDTSSADESSTEGAEAGDEADVAATADEAGDNAGGGGDAEQQTADEGDAAASGDDVDLVALIGSGHAPDGMDDSVKSAVDGVCASCHMAGVAGAPMLGDKDAWAPRAETGLAALSSTVVSGKGAMPAMGGASLSEDQIPMAVKYLISKQP